MIQFMFIMILSLWTSRYMLHGQKGMPATVFSLSLFIKEIIHKVSSANSTLSMLIYLRID